MSKMNMEVQLIMTISVTGFNLTLMNNDMYTYVIFIGNWSVASYPLTVIILIKISKL